MPAVTFTEIASEAFEILQVFMPGEALPAADVDTARVACNRMLSQWRTRRTMIPLIGRERFATVVDQGGPDDPYTIGPDGDFDTTRPSNQNAIESANLILTTTDPEVRVPLGIYTTAAYSANQLPSMSNTQPTGLYYNPTYDDDLGSIFLWPVPTVAYNELELFLWKPIEQFADATTTYYLPDGADDAIVYNVAFRLQGRHGKKMSDDDRQLAVSTLAAYKRNNLQIVDCMTDAYMFSAGRNTLFNINTGQ